MRIRLLLLALLTIVLMVSNIFVGAVTIPPASILKILSGHSIGNDAIEFIVTQIRIPQSITALLAGSSLALSGLLLQTLFRNPLAGPSILGITSGASLGVAIILLLTGGIGGSITSFLTQISVTAGALIGSFCMLMVLIFLAKRLQNNLTILIAGMMMGYLSNSLVTLLTASGTAKGVQSYVMWGMGTFSGVSFDNLQWFGLISLISFIIVIFLIKPLNLLLLGDNYAANLGVNIKKTRLWLLLASGLMAGVVTAYCGPIGFIGMAMPHVGRLITRSDDHRHLIPATLLLGASLALLCNLLSVLPKGYIIPINALTPIAGIPVVLYVILRKKSN